MSEVSRHPIASKPAPARTPMAGSLLVRSLRALDAELVAALPSSARAPAPRMPSSRGQVRTQSSETPADDEAIHDMRVAIRRLAHTPQARAPGLRPRHADAVRRGVHARSPRDRRAPRRGGPRRDARRARRATRPPSSPGRAPARARAGLASAASSRDSRGRSLARARAAPERARHAPGRARRAIDRRRSSRGARSSARGANVEQQRDAPTRRRGRAPRSPDRLQGAPLRRRAPRRRRSRPTSRPWPARVEFQKRLGEIHDVDMALAALNRARGLDPTAHARCWRRSRRSGRSAWRSTWRKTARARPGDPASPSRPRRRRADPRPSASSRSGRSRAS